MNKEEVIPAVTAAINTVLAEANQCTIHGKTLYVFAYKTSDGIICNIVNKGENKL